MSFELPHSSGGDGLPIPVGETPATPEPKPEPIRLHLAHDDADRRDMLDQLLRSFEQWGQGVQLRLQRQDEQSGQLERQLAQAEEKEASLRARLSDLNAELGRLNGEIGPLVTEVSQLSGDRDRLSAEIRELHGKLGGKVAYWQMLVAGALLGVAGLGYLALPKLIGAFTALVAAVPV